MLQLEAKTLIFKLSFRTTLATSFNVYRIVKKNIYVHATSIAGRRRNANYYTLYN